MKRYIITKIFPVKFFNRVKSVPTPTGRIMQLLKNLLKDLDGLNKSTTLWPKKSSDEKDQEIRGPAVLIYWTFKKGKSSPTNHAPSKSNETTVFENDRISVGVMFLVRLKHFGSFCQSRSLIECLRVPCTRNNYGRMIEKLKTIIGCNFENMKLVMDVDEKMTSQLSKTEDDLGKLEEKLIAISLSIPDWKISSYYYHRYNCAMSFRNSAVMTRSNNAFALLEGELKRLTQQTHALKKTYGQEIQALVSITKTKYEDMYKSIFIKPPNESSRKEFRELLNNEIRSAASMSEAIDASSLLRAEISEMTQRGRKILEMGSSMETRDSARSDFLEFCIKKDKEWKSIVKFCNSSCSLTASDATRKLTNPERIILNDCRFFSEMTSPDHWVAKFEPSPVMNFLRSTWSVDQFSIFCLERKQPPVKILSVCQEEDPLSMVEVSLRNAMKIACRGVEYRKKDKCVYTFIRCISQAEKLPGAMENKLREWESRWNDALFSFKSAYKEKYDILYTYRTFHMPTPSVQYLQNIGARYVNPKHLAVDCKLRIDILSHKLKDETDEIRKAVADFQKLLSDVKKHDSSFAEYRLLC